MFIVAGPPGAGKSKAFPVAGFGVDFFNADDRASALNGGSYLDIPRRIRDEVSILFESFVLDHIERRASCAFETTLRSAITFDQAALAKRAGFTTEMRYVALRDVYDNSAWGVTPQALLQAENAEVVYLAEQIPDWLARALRH